MTTRHATALAALVLGTCSVLRASAEVALEPGMPAITPRGAPLLWQMPPDADRTSAGAALIPPQPYRWLAEPGEAFSVTAETPGGPEEALLTAWDWGGQPVAQVALRCPTRETVTFAVRGSGVWLLTLDLMRGAECTARLARSFGVCHSNAGLRDQWRAGGFLVGACSFPGRQHWSNDYGPGHPPGLSEQASREMDADLCVRLGIQVIRPDLPVWWPAEDQPMDFSRADACMETLTSRGFTLDLQIGQPGADWAVLPEYAGVTDPKWRYPDREDAVRRMAREVAARYGSHAEFFELNNEPDNHDFWRGTPEQYLDFCRWVSEEIRAQVPGALIADGGYTFMVPRWTGLFARGLRDSTSLVTYHSHGGVEVTRQSFGALEAVMTAAGRDAPVYANTEMGYCAWRLDAEVPMAATAIQKLLYCWAHGHLAALLYASREITGPRMTANDWGMVDYFMCPRFAYGAVAAFIRAYAGARPEAVLREDDRLTAYVFRRGEDRLVSVFAPTGPGHTVYLEHSATDAVLLDAMGNRTDVPSGSRTSLRAGQYPSTLVLRNASAVALRAEP
jgi:hypothetical protein